MSDTPTNPYGYADARWQEHVDEALFTGRARREAHRLLKAEESPLQEFPETVDLRTRAENPTPRPPFRIAGWQPANSRVVLSAQFKSGKSTMVGNLVRSLVDGDPWLDVADVIPVPKRVSILDFEMSGHTIEEWLADQSAIDNHRIDLTVFRGKGTTFNILDPIVRREWVARLAERETDYVVLDCLRPVLDALGLDEHRDAGKFFGPFDALLDEAGISEALVVHHAGHNGERSRGDSRIRDWPDVEWRLTRESDHPDSTRYITAYGRDVSVEEMKLAFDKDSRRLTALDGSRTDFDADKALVAVLKALGGTGDPISGRVLEDLLKDTDHSRRAIRGAMKLGLRRDLIVSRAGKHGATLYELPQSWVKAKFGGGEGGM